jgi:hypothetical protein
LKAQAIHAVTALRLDVGDKWISGNSRANLGRRRPELFSHSATKAFHASIFESGDVLAQRLNTGFFRRIHARVAIAAQ